MRSPFQRTIWFGFAVALAIITWLAVLSYQNEKNTANASRWVSHTNKVLYHSEEILSLTIDLESGQRGFALTGIEEFLEPSLNAARLLDQHLESLSELVGGSPAMQERLRVLRELSKQKVELTMRTIKARREEGFDASRAIIASLEGKQLTDKIRAIIKELQADENQLLEERTTLLQSRSERFNRYYISMLAVTGLILMMLFYLIFINLRARTKAEHSLRLASERIQDMYNNAPCGYHSLDDKGCIVEINNTWLQWLQYSREEVVNRMHFAELLTAESSEKFTQVFMRFKIDGFVRDEEYTAVRKDKSTFQILVNATALYDGQKRYVKSRATVLDFTEQKKALTRIEQLNQELESFSYSVSHDLRAPLRSIDGYAQILIEDYSHQLDAEGKRVLQVVVNNTRRMAKLIDDLLDFSRVGRKEFAKTSINTDSLVQSIVAEVRANEPDRHVDVRIKELLPTLGDPNLIRQVWFNLIANAFKYTRKTDHPTVEIGSYTEAGNAVFFIKDNGTGFDMQYAGKLFGVFQRLHRQNDFEGTGVGLAIVHRIVTRHGGNVWANAEVGKGAVFFFRLPVKETY